MIKGEFLLDSSGLLKGFSLSGHESIEGGRKALFCAVVSATSRSFVRICESWNISLEAIALERGELSFRLEEAPFNAGEYKGAGDFFLQTLLDLSAENPALIKIDIVVDD